MVTQAYYVCLCNQLLCARVCIFSSEYISARSVSLSESVVAVVVVVGCSA